MVVRNLSFRTTKPKLSQKATKAIPFSTEKGLEPKRMQFIHPLSDRPPTMVLIEARKDAKPDLSILPPLVMYDRPQVRSQALEAIYRAP